MSIRSILRAAEVTQPKADVAPIRSLDDMAAAVRKAGNYRVTVEAEKARAEQDLEEIVAHLAEATELENQAKRDMIAMFESVTGIKIT